MGFNIRQLFRRKKDSDPIANKRKWKVRRTQLLVFLSFFLVAEVVLRIIGYRPGVVENMYYQSGEVEYSPVLYADELGITHHSADGRFIDDQVINGEGYFSEVEYTKHAMDSLRALGKKIVFLVGDSFTAGCCPDSYTSTYAYLLNQSDEYEVLNFGVGGTDPLHYELVVQKYLPLLEPDLVAVAVYLGNDEMPYDRTPKPYIPVCYPVAGGHWLSSEAYINLRPANTYFKNFNEAKKFFYSYYSLRSDQSNWFEKIIRHSVILSKGYLYAKIKLEQHRMKDELFYAPEKPEYTYNHLKGIQDFCSENNTPVLFTAIQSPPDLAEEIDVKVAYHHLFKELQWSVPHGVTNDDYDGPGIGNHYTAAGHLKFANYLKMKIAKALE